MHIGPNDQSARLWAFLFRFFIYSVIMRKYCRLYCLINIRACMPPVLQKNERRSVGLTMRWPARVKSGDFFKPPQRRRRNFREGNPENSKHDAVDVAPSVPAHEVEPAAEPSSENKAAAVPTTVTAEPATVEPARRGPVDQDSRS